MNHSHIKRIAQSASLLMGGIALVLGCQSCGGGDEVSGGAGSGGANGVLTSPSSGSVATSGTFKSPASGFSFHGVGFGNGSILPKGIAAGRFNNGAAGYTDLAVTGTDGIYIARSDGKGSFSTTSGNPGLSPTIKFSGGGTTVNPTAIALGDFYQADGALDIAALDTTNGTVIMVKGGGNGTFSILATYQTTSPFNKNGTPVSIATGVFSPILGSGLDFMVANSGDNSVTGFNNNNVPNQPAYSIKAYTSFNLTGPTQVSTGLSVAGQPGILVLHSGFKAAQVLIGPGNGTFSKGPSIDLSSNLNQNMSVSDGGLAIADFDGDGIKDFVSYLTLPNFTSAASIYIGKESGEAPGTGDGTFTLNNGFSLPAALSSVQIIGGITAADFNGDGKPDFAYAGRKSSTPTVLGVCLNTTKQKALSFNCKEYPLPSSDIAPVAITVGDFNNDKIMDIAVANSDDNISGLNAFYVLFGQP